MKNFAYLFSFFKSKLRLFIKHSYYRITVPLHRILKKPMIENPSGFSIEISSVCNFNCVFCAYQHTTKKMREIMSLDEFKKAVDEIIRNGGKRIALTPLTGDIFADRKGITRKIDYLESQDAIQSYSFTTNVSLIDNDKINFLKTTKKLKNVKLSIYGHDQDSFRKISQTNLYDKVFKNLQNIKANIMDLKFNIDIGIRSYMDFNPKTGNSELITLVKSISEYDNVSIGFHKHYTNWGGYVTKEDLNGLPIILKDDKKGYKSGPCARLFNYMVLSNSDVILCACRDAMREMVIGNLKKDPLEKIISIKNPLYKKWVDDQENDKFNGPCKDCDMYRPVYALPHYDLGKKTNRSYVGYDTFFNKK